MKTILFYNVASFIILIWSIYVLRDIRRRNLSPRAKRVIKAIAAILLVCTVLAVLFLDAIAFGIIGLVPN